MGSDFSGKTPNDATTGQETLSDRFDRLATTCLRRFAGAPGLKGLICGVSVTGRDGRTFQIELPADAKSDVQPDWLSDCQRMLIGPLAGWIRRVEITFTDGTTTVCECDDIRLTGTAIDELANVLTRRVV